MTSESTISESTISETKSTESISEDLRELTSICQDGQLGYLTAAHQVENSQLKTIFSSYATQRSRFVRDLEDEVRRLGSTDTEAPSPLGSLHRGWMQLKGAISGGSGAAIVAACETGEDHAAAAYERVVDLELPGQTGTLVARQWEAIKEAHSHMLRLKHEGEQADFPKDAKA